MPIGRIESILVALIIQMLVTIMGSQGNIRFSSEAIAKNSLEKNLTMEGISMEAEIKTASEAFKIQPQDRRNAAKTLLPVICIGMSDLNIEDLLGEPDYKYWEYSLFYSSVLTVKFDNQGKVIEISSDVSGSSDEMTDTGLADPKVAAAINEFKTQPYNRQRAAEQLIPLIAIGMQNTDLQNMLGAPTQLIWNYNLYDTGPAALIVRFDPERNVKAVSLVGME